MPYCIRASSASRAAVGTTDRHAAPHTDDWSKIKDLKERRRVQNRNAQRNYRE